MGTEESDSRLRAANSELGPTQGIGMLMTGKGIGKGTMGEGNPISKDQAHNPPKGQPRRVAPPERTPGRNYGGGRGSGGEGGGLGRGAVRGPGTGGCFVAGTRVHIEGGYKAIEAVQVGEKVWSFNHFTGEIELRSVLRTQTTQRNDLVIMVIDDERVIRWVAGQEASLIAINEIGIWPNEENWSVIQCLLRGCECERLNLVGLRGFGLRFAQSEAQLARGFLQIALAYGWGGRVACRPKGQLLRFSHDSWIEVSDSREFLMEARKLVAGFSSGQV
jgi:hypothetical protein